MIFLNILLWVLVAVLLMVSGILFLPVVVSVKFKEDFFLKVSFCGIKVYELKENEPKGKHEKAEEKPEEAQEKKENAAKTLFKRLKAKHGFTGAVRRLMAFLKDCLTHIKKLLRHIKVKDIRLNLIYGGADAADTAIKYGEICSAVYPVLALVDTVRNIKFKKINVSSDFEKQRTDFDFSLKVKMQIFFLAVAAFGLYKQYKNFLDKEDIQ